MKRLIQRLTTVDSFTRSLLVIFVKVHPTVYAVSDGATAGEKRENDLLKILYLFIYL